MHDSQSSAAKDAQRLSDLHKIAGKQGMLAALQQMNPYLRPGPNPTEMAAEHLSESVIASGLAENALRKPGKQTAIPPGWKTVDNTLAAELKKAGAVYLESPSGMKFIAFSKAAAKKDLAGRLGDHFGKPTSGISAAANIGELLKNDHNVTFTGTGRAGGLAKLAAEAASHNPDGSKKIAPKLCVPINSSSIDPKTYKALGLDPKAHQRNTVHVISTINAVGRVRAGGVTQLSDTLGANASILHSGTAPAANTPGLKYGHGYEAAVVGQAQGKPIDFQSAAATGELRKLGEKFTNEVVRQRMGDAIHFTDGATQGHKPQYKETAYKPTVSKGRV